MSQLNPPHNHDQEMPPRTGDEEATREPLVPRPGPEPHERRPLPEEETYERNREKNGSGRAEQEDRL